MRLKRGLQLIFCLIALSGKAQNGLIYLPRFTQLTTTQTLYNPASSEYRYKNDIRLLESVNTGQLSGIRNLYLNGSASFKNSGSRRNSDPGRIQISIVKERQGSLLSFTRVYGGYVQPIALSSQTKLFWGMMFGLFNYSADNTATSGTISYFAPDGSTGFILKRNFLEIGISLTQMFNNKIKLQRSDLTLSRSLCFTYNQEINVSPDLVIKPVLLFNYSTRNNWYFTFSSTFILSRIFIFGTGYSYKRSTFFSIGLLNETAFKNRFTFLLTYNSPWLTPIYNNNQIFEFSIIFSRKYISKD